MLELHKGTRTRILRSKDKRLVEVMTLIDVTVMIIRITNESTLSREVDVKCLKLFK